MEREGDFDLFAEIINTLSNWLYTYILIILLLGAGVFFTIKTRFVQFRCLREAIRVVKEPSDDKESISSFQALMVSTRPEWEREILREFQQPSASEEQGPCSGCGWWPF